MAAVVALVMSSVACSNPTAVSDPVGPPESFAPTPTIDDSVLSTTSTTGPVTTTTIDTQQTALYRFDPRTLQTLPGSNPIPMGDYFWGSVSDNGTWLAGRAEQEDGNGGELLLVDLAGWEVVARWPALSYVDPHVTDEGVVYHLGSGSTWPQLTRLTRGMESPGTAAELPAGFTPWNPIHQHETMISIYGTLYGDDGGRETAMLVTVDLANGAVTEIRVPQVTIGAIEEVDIGEDWKPFIGAYPAVVWDQERALIVHADQDVVTEVDLAGGGVTDHRFDVEESVWGGLFSWLAAPALAGGMPTADSTRSAALSPDGLRLYVATRTGEAVFESESDWYLLTRSVGLEVIDTRTWTRIDRLDAPIGEVALSPDGSTLLGRGFTQEDRLSTTSFVSHGVFVIEASTLDVLAHHESPNEWYNPVSFSADGRFGYAGSWTKTNVLDLENGEVVGSRLGTQNQLWGEAGILTDSYLSR